MALNKLESMGVLIFMGPYQYVSGLVFRACEKIDTIIKTASKRGMVITYEYSVALVDELETAASKLDHYIQKGKITAEEARTLNADIQAARRRLEKYILRNDGSRDEGDGSELVPV